MLAHPAVGVTDVYSVHPRGARGSPGIENLGSMGYLAGGPGSSCESWGPLRQPFDRWRAGETSRRIKEGRLLLRNQFKYLTITALFMMVNAGLPAVSLADEAAAAAQAPAADLARGEQLFQLCTQCHGADGGGNSSFLAPGIAGLPGWYVDAQLTKFKTGVRGLHPEDTGGLRMYPMSLWLREEADQKAVAAYIASMPVAEIKNELEPGDASMGAGYYAVCGACHMADGSGNQGMGAPPLTDMSDWYLFSAISKYKSGARGSGQGDALGPVMIGMVATLPSDDAIRDVIAHIQGLGK